MQVINRLLTESRIIAIVGLSAREDRPSHGVAQFWMQLGVIDDEAAAHAAKAGLEVVMDKCIKIEHMQMR